MRGLAAAVLLLLLAPVVSAQPGEPATFFVRGAVGFGTQSLGDVNDDIAMDASALRPLSTRLEWGEFGSAVPFGLEFGYQFSERWSWAFGFTWHKSTVEHLAVLDFVDSGSGVAYVGEESEDEDLKLLDLYGTATTWIPRVAGLHLGAQLGFAMGSLHLSDGVDVDGDDGSFLLLHENGDANAVGYSAGIYTGYEATVSPRLGLSARIGYFHCNLGKMDGRYRLVGTSDTGSVNVSGSGPVTDSNGRSMDWDVSGVRASAAVTYRFRWAVEL
jgi:hypothetical protein